MLHYLLISAITVVSLSPLALLQWQYRRSMARIAKNSKNNG